MSWFRASGERGALIAACCPDAAVVGVERADELTRSFLTSAIAQKRLASQTDGRVPRLMDLGVSSEGAYRVIELFPLRASDLIEARVRPTGAALKALVSGVLEAVAAFEAVGRGHGAIDPGRVLFDPAGGVGGRWRVVLDAPLGDDAIGGAEPDLRQVGRLVYELVVHETYRATAGYPLEESSAFGQLGRSSSGFLALANTLLDPGLEVGATSLTASGVLEQVARINTREKRGGGGLLIGAAVALVTLGAGGVAAWQFLKPPPETEPVRVANLDRAALEAWCGHAGAWLVKFRNDLERRAELRSALESDPTLVSGVVEPLMAKDVSELNPIAVTGAGSAVGDFDEVLGWVDANFELFEGETQVNAQINEASSTVAGVVAAIESWAVLDRAGDLRSMWRDERGWSGAASTLDEAVAPLTLDRFGSTLGRELAAMVEVSGEMDALESKYRAIVGRAEEISGAGEATDDGDPEDPLLVRFAGFVELRARQVASGIGPGESAIAQTMAALDDLEEGVAVLGNFVLADTGGWGGVERELFDDESETLRDFGSGTEPSLALYRRWLTEAGREGFRSLDPALDPRRDWVAADRAASLETDLASLRAEYPSDAAREIASASARYGDLDGRLAAIIDEIGALNSDSLGWKRRNKTRIETGVQKLDGDLRELSRQIGDVVAEVRVTWEELVPALRDRTGVSALGLASIDDAYRARRDELIAFREPVADRAKLLREDERDLSAFLRSVESRLVIEPDLSAKPDGFDEARFAEAVRAEVDSAAGDVLASVSWSSGRFVQGPATETAIESARMRLAVWARSAVDAAADYAAAEALLDGVYLPEEVGGADRTLLGVVEAWAPFLADAPGVASAMGGVVDRAGAVIDVWVGAPMEGLVEAARGFDEPLAVSRAAYARLTDASGGRWPATAEELAVDLEASDRVLSSLDGATDVARIDQIASAVRDVRDARLTSGLGMLGDLASMERGLAALADSDVDLATMPGWVRFNASLWSLTNSSGGVVGDDDVRALATRYVSVLGGLRSSVGSLEGGPEASAWIDELGVVAAPPADDGPAFRPDEEGPGRAGWTVEASEDLSRLTYTSPDGAAVVGFAAVELDLDRGEPRLVFLGTEEVSIRVFNAIVGDDPDRWGELADDRVWVEFDTVFRDAVFAAQDGWQGPRSWRWDEDAGRLEPSVTWLFPTTDMQPQSPAYAPGLGDPNDPTRVSAEQGPPSLDHPMNAVSFLAALEVAQWLGCRLPTTEEWLAGYARYEAGLSASDWNLRDATLGLQVDHLDALQNQFGGVLQIPMPEEESFLLARGRVDEWTTWAGADDGRLWFDVTSERGNVLRGMVGNIAELCDEGRERIRVIGASATSTSADTLEQAIAPREVIGRFRDAGFADFGFRLAFEAAGALRPSARVLLARLLERAPYLRG
ncbi:MAG: SUMF1/EgtB/PvdO family nonheme iron enzyme [Planctomycetota bacterium]